jgi:penicillin-binding protein 2
MIGDSPRIRLAILGVVGLSLFAALFARLWYLQVIGTEEYQLAAEVQNTRTIAIEAPRGRILDAQGRVVVDNRISIVVTIDPEDLIDLEGAEREEALTHLAQVLTAHGHPTKVADIEDRLVDPRYNPVEPRPVATDVSEEFEIYLMERQGEFVGVDVRREAVRVYPYGQMAAHVLGYVGRISEDELEAEMGTEADPVTDHDKPYDRDDNIGKTGVERTYEDELRGTPGVRLLEVDARGEPIRTLDYQPPVPGNDLQLTIDIDVQALAENALRQGLEEARARPPRGDNPVNVAPAGSVVVQDPRTGAVIAMASYPTYDPSEFVGGISADRYEELLGDAAADDPFTNRALAGQYAPGSTFKLVTGYAALRDGLITEQTGWYDKGTYEAIGCQAGEQCVFRSPEGAGGRSYSISGALTDSSDTFFYSLGDRSWIEEGRNRTGIQDAAEDLGLHHPTGVSLPFEQGGWIPTPDRKQERHDDNPEAFPYAEWYSGDNIIMAIGQGDVLTTPMQLVNAYSAFASRGVVHEPNTALRVLKPGGDPDSPGDVLRVFEPRVARELDMSAPWWDAMNAGFYGVPTSGTATSAFAGWDHAGWPVAGKTGTAEVEGKADTALFVGYGGPAGEAPSYAISVVLEQSGFGGEAAAPVAKWILEPLSGQVPMPPAQTVEERAAGPVVEDCAPEAFDPETDSTTTTSSTIVNPLVEGTCPDEEGSPTDTTVPTGLVD